MIISYCIVNIQIIYTIQEKVGAQNEKNSHEFERAFIIICMWK